MTIVNGDGGGDTSVVLRRTAATAASSSEDSVLHCGYRLRGMFSLLNAFKKMRERGFGDFGLGRDSFISDQLMRLLLVMQKNSSGTKVFFLFHAYFDFQPFVICSAL